MDTAHAKKQTKQNQIKIKSETELTASALKKDPKHTRGYKNAF